MQKKKKARLVSSRCRHSANTQSQKMSQRSRASCPLWQRTMHSHSRQARRMLKLAGCPVLEPLSSYSLDGVVVGRVQDFDNTAGCSVGGRACVNVSNVACGSWDSTCREGRGPRASGWRARGRSVWKGRGALRKCGRTRSTGVRVSRGGKDLRGWNAGASVGHVFWLVGLVSDALHVLHGRDPGLLQMEEAEGA